MNSSYDMVKIIMRERELDARAHQRGAKAPASSLRSAARSLARKAHRAH
jgi:hypothetical protein